MKRNAFVLLYFILFLPSLTFAQSNSLDRLSPSTKEILSIATKVGEFHNEVVSCMINKLLYSDSDSFHSEILLNATMACIENMETDEYILQSEEIKYKIITQIQQQFKESLSDTSIAKRNSDSTELSEILGIELKYIEKYQDNINDSLFDTVQINNLTNQLLIEIDNDDTLNYQEKYKDIFAVEMQRHSLLLWTHYRKNKIVDKLNSKFIRR